ncbi:uncharacterized protein PAN0_003c1624 [Moesziomyces antarcticus]|uniref:uncharacterized protein n=1 Tax=Pseudozyma antarctica TaxID=84753 RepID=UPI0007198416|nr:uncharacterized protein PAN0_003c1624 [Moesziomyces antarcticus]GAK63420.1 hypothetical protein PAN0_003c1624 [Moesziomyces antarcticus]
MRIDPAKLGRAMGRATRVKQLHYDALQCAVDANLRAKPVVLLRNLRMHAAAAAQAGTVEAQFHFFPPYNPLPWVAPAVLDRPPTAGREPQSLQPQAFFRPLEYVLLHFDEDIVTLCCTDQLWNASLLAIHLRQALRHPKIEISTKTDGVLHTTKPGQHLKYTIFSNNDQAPFPNWRFSLRLDAMPIVTVVTSLATPQLRRWPVSKNATPWTAKGPTPTTTAAATSTPQTTAIAAALPATLTATLPTTTITINALVGRETRCKIERLFHRSPDVHMCALSVDKRRRQFSAEDVCLMLLRTLKLGPVPLDFLTRLALADALEQQPNHILKKRELATSSHPSATRGGCLGSATQQPPRVAGN